MEEVLHVPARHGTVLRDLTHTVLERSEDGGELSFLKPNSDPGVGGNIYLVVLSKQLHTNYSEDEDDNGKDKRQVSQSPHGVSDDLDEGIKSWP